MKLSTTFEAWSHLGEFPPNKYNEYKLILSASDYSCVLWMRPYDILLGSAWSSYLSICLALGTKTNYMEGGLHGRWTKLDQECAFVGVTEFSAARSLPTRLVFLVNFLCHFRNQSKYDCANACDTPPCLLTNIFIYFYTQWFTAWIQSCTCQVNG